MKGKKKIMKKIKNKIFIRKIILLVLSIVSLILELLPYGVIFRTETPEGHLERYTYSYFNLIPFQNGNVGPFLTAICTCLLCVLCITLLLLKKDTMQISKIAFVITFVASFIALIHDLTSFSILSGAICALLGIGIIITFQKS